MNITNDDRKRALLLHYVGEQTHDIYDANKPVTEPDEGSKFVSAKTVLENVFKPKKNELVAEHEFTVCRQKDTQTFDEYITELRQLAKYCSFNENNDARIRSQLISNCKSTQLRKRVFREPEKYKSLDEVIDLGRSMDAADKYSNQIERDLGFASAKAVTVAPNKRSGQSHSRGRPSQRGRNTHRRPKRDNSQSHGSSRYNPTKSNTCFKCGGQISMPSRWDYMWFLSKTEPLGKMCFEKKKSST